MFASNGKGTSRLSLGILAAPPIVGDAMAKKIDELGNSERATVNRLTERECECLRRWLEHQSAKEIALDLGISHHAVEKRLRLARAKLGVASSIEAARMLEANDRYKRQGTASPDLETGVPRAERWFAQPLIAGAISMSFIAAAFLVFALQSTSNVSQTGTVASTRDAGGATVAENGYGGRNMVEASPAEIVSITQTTFHHLDADHSGFLEATESPVSANEGPRPVYRRDSNGNAVPTGEMVELSDQGVRDDFYRRADSDGDGRISYPEYHQWSAPNLARSGIPADWQEDMSSWMTPEG